MIVLHLYSFENNRFELDSSVSKKKCVSTVKPSQEGEFFFMVMKHFLSLFNSTYKNTSRSIKPCFCKEIQQESTTLKQNEFYIFANAAIPRTLENFHGLDTYL